MLLSFSDGGSECGQDGHGGEAPPSSHAVRHLLSRDLHGEVGLGRLAEW